MTKKQLINCVKLVKATYERGFRGSHFLHFLLYKIKEMEFFLVLREVHLRLAVQSSTEFDFQSAADQDSVLSFSLLLLWLNRIEVRLFYHSPSLAKISVHWSSALARTFVGFLLLPLLILPRKSTQCYKTVVARLFWSRAKFKLIKLRKPAKKITAFFKCSKQIKLNCFLAKLCPKSTSTVC